LSLPENQALVIMAKEPMAGRTKTRLCPPLTAEEAADLYRCFLEDIIVTVRQVFQGNSQIEPCFGYAPVEAAGYFRQLAPDFGRIAQEGERLNERLQSVFETCFKRGNQKVAAMNSDSPTLPGSYLAEAFERLETADVVLGPCEDGGYYLIGMKRPIPEIILPVQMSTERVLAETLALIDSEGLTVDLLPEWYDVDTAEELERLKRELDGVESRTAAWFGQ
jgi:rSAM/selenodomain-associated transferase 1